LFWRRRRPRYSYEVSYRDAFTLAREVIRELFNIIEKYREKGSIKEYLAAEIATLESAWTINPLFPNLALLMSEVVESTDGSIEALEKLHEKLASTLENEIKNIKIKCINELQSKKLKEIGITVIGYNQIIEECIESANIKNLRVNVLEFRPKGDGITMLENLRASGVDARLLPDYAIQQAVEEAGALIITLDAITYDGLALSKPPSKALALAALESGIETIGLTTLISYQTSLSALSAKRVPTTRLYIREFNEYITLNLYDVLSISFVSKIINGKGVYRPEHIDVETEAYNYINEILEGVMGDIS